MEFSTTNTFLTLLIFTDDSAIFADTDAEANNILHHITQSHGLKIKADKTKVMAIDGSQVNVYLKQVKALKYLESLLQEKIKAASATKVHSRTGQAKATLAWLKWCLWEKANISTKTKILLF
ncbi:hypothetical protein ABG768_019984 [Culter alburnus]|uniref:Reverse transcriptase domain-containing protein n=1 Tax=Culter alburnus TaxID=194366 RepID=A0AAW2AZT3_CULAL